MTLVKPNINFIDDTRELLSVKKSHHRLVELIGEIVREAGGKCPRHPKVDEDLLKDVGIQGIGNTSWVQCEKSLRERMETLRFRVKEMPEVQTTIDKAIAEFIDSLDNRVNEWLTHLSEDNARVKAIFRNKKTSYRPLSVNKLTYDHKDMKAYYTVDLLSRPAISVHLALPLSTKSGAKIGKGGVVDHAFIVNAFDALEINTEEGVIEVYPVWALAPDVILNQSKNSPILPNICRSDPSEQYVEDAVVLKLGNEWTIEFIPLDNVEHIDAVILEKPINRIMNRHAKTVSEILRLNK